MNYPPTYIFCEGYKPENIEKCDNDLELYFDSGSPALNNIDVELTSLREAILRKDDYAKDLIRIAIYVYITDRGIQRGGKFNAYDKDWNKPLKFFIPVLEPDFWNQESIKTALSDVLYFAVGHNYTFEFSKWNPDVNNSMFMNLWEAGFKETNADCISMFSGGIDSLYSTIELIEEGKKPLLFSHKSAIKIKTYRDNLVSLLNNDYDIRLDKWELGINSKKDIAVEETQRSRGFLYAVLGSAFAKCMGLRDVYLSDNGIVTFNLKYTDQIKETMNTRSTNPKFMYLFNELTKLIWRDEAPEVKNKLLWLTRGEVVQKLKEKNKSYLLHDNFSCAHPRQSSKAQPHCGVCSQCIDRRIAVDWADINDDDEPRFHYQKDIFTAELEDDRKKSENEVAQVEQLFRKAKRILASNEDQLIGIYPEIVDYCPATENTQSFALKAIDLHKRHSQQIFEVLKKQLDKNHEDYLLNRLPQKCFLNIVYRDSNPDEDLNNYISPIKKEILFDNDQKICTYKEIQIPLTTGQFNYFYKLALNPAEYIHHDELIGHDVNADSLSKYFKGVINKKFRGIIAKNRIELPKDFELIVNKRKVGNKINILPERIGFIDPKPQFETV